MKIINNVNLDSLKRTQEEIKKDLTKAKKTITIAGNWNLEEAKPQFTAEVKYENGSIVLEADQPTAMGGNGLKPNPNNYCLFGLASCFAATIAMIASMENIILKKLFVTAHGNMDSSASFGLSDNPLVEGVKLKVDINADISDDKVKELLRLAEERCPGVYCIKNPIELKVEY